MMGSMTGMILGGKGSSSKLPTDSTTGISGYTVQDVPVRLDLGTDLSGVGSRSLMTSSRKHKSERLLLREEGLEEV